MKSPCKADSAARSRVPSCEYGYTEADLERYFGAKRGQSHRLWDQLRGQTGMICDKGCAKGGPHGFVSYISDVEEWAL